MLFDKRYLLEMVNPKTKESYLYELHSDGGYCFYHSKTGLMFTVERGSHYKFVEDIRLLKAQGYIRNKSFDHKSDHFFSYNGVKSPLFMKITKVKQIKMVSPDTDDYFEYELFSNNSFTQYHKEEKSFYMFGKDSLNELISALSILESRGFYEQTI